ncbi:MAG: arginine--tRNA ligase [Akkermansia sp.]|nr:arginine--tRNA ligase [Akkermansia sp.]
MTIPALLARQLDSALKQVLGENLPGDFHVEATPSQNLRFGDYQSNAAMVLAKPARMNPRALAQRTIDALGDSDLGTVEIAGPGFLNFRLHPETFAARISAMLDDERLGVEPADKPETIVIDFSAPNVAKPMHVGHIRSTIIGDALARVARFMGHHVITDNHIGDWGTQFGMILWGWKHLLDHSRLEADPIDELLCVYKKVNDLCRKDESLLSECRAELVKLQRGDSENLSIWKQCIAVTKRGLEKIYGQLDIHFDYWMGESAYNDALAPLVQDLISRGIARESDGAICVFSDGFHRPEEDPFLVQENGEWKPLPCIIRKADGGFLYATTDLATLDYRTNVWKADSIWYVVGISQEQHFRQIFDVERMRGVSGDFRHVGFGSILGKDRRPFKTRSGDTVSLQDVLDEAVSRAKKVIEEKSPDMPDAEKETVAQAVGIGAVKFAELSQNRLTDYVFDWDKMLSLTGDTAPYLQNSHVRIRSIFRKLGSAPREFSREIHLRENAEIHLARMLVRFAEVVPAVLDDCRPNILAAYLFDLARAFHSFYEACPVLRSEGSARESRLSLCELTSRVLSRGMNLLGIHPTERM